MSGLIGDGGKKAAREAEARMAEQKQKEDLRLAEADSEIERKKQLMKSGGAGRSLLIKTSPTGVPAVGAENLGGA